jgi:D-inositol-3-phosphate glycosyltransferase
VPCGVNLELFHPHDRRTVRKQLNIHDDDTVVLFVGRFDPLKGIERLFAAATYLRRYQKLKLLIIGGDGPQAPETRRLQDLARRWEIDRTVRLLGRVEQNNLPPYYSAADVSVIPSYYESFGLVGLEALACGTPVVSTRVGAMPIIIKDGSNGQLVDNACPRTLAEGIESVVMLAANDMLSADAIRDSVRHFGWSSVATAVLEHYRGVGDSTEEALMQEPLCKNCASLN